MHERAPAGTHPSWTGSGRREVADRDGEQFTDPALGALGFLLDLEATQGDLASLIIALDLIVSAPDGINGEDMPGAKIVAACALERLAGLRHAWREAAERARSAQSHA